MVPSFSLKPDLPCQMVELMHKKLLQSFENDVNEINESITVATLLTLEWIM